MTPTRPLIKHPEPMMEVARDEVEAWCGPGAEKPMNRGVVMMILFAFIHRYVTGKTVEQTFFPSSRATEPEYMI